MSASEALPLFQRCFRTSPQGFVSLFFLKRETGATLAYQVPVETYKGALDLCERQAGEGYDCYFSPSPLRSRLETGKRGTKDMYLGSNVLWVDLDAKTKTKPQLLEELTNFKPHPSIIVDSGHGYHAYWELNEFADPLSVERRNLWIANMFKADHCHSIDHLLRVPGTLNWKDTK